MQLQDRWSTHYAASSLHNKTPHAILAKFVHFTMRTFCKITCWTKRLFYIHYCSSLRKAVGEEIAQVWAAMVSWISQKEGDASVQSQHGLHQQEESVGKFQTSPINAAKSGEKDNYWIQAIMPMLRNDFEQWILKLLENLKLPWRSAMASVHSH